MKLAIVFFLYLVPFKLESFMSVDDQLQGNRMPGKYILIEGDATRMEQKFQEHLFVSKQRKWPAYTATLIEGPVIKKDTGTPWDDRRFPIGNDLRGEQPYAVLPNSITFPDVKKRLLETLLVRRNGRKLEHITDSYG
jgi:hypothetical protein